MEQVQQKPIPKEIIESLGEQARKVKFYQKNPLGAISSGGDEICYYIATGKRINEQPGRRGDEPSIIPLEPKKPKNTPS